MGKASLLVRWMVWTPGLAALGLALGQSALQAGPVVVSVPASAAVGPAVAAPAAAGMPVRPGAGGLRTPGVMRLNFADRKPVLGLPLGSGRSMGHCSTDGTVFFDVSPGSTGGVSVGAPELYRISTDGEAKHVLRTLPKDFTNVSVRDFFAGEQMLVTLLEAVKRDDDDAANPVRETKYFLSMSDHDGDLASLVQLDVRFKPLKVALFASGEIVVLGWDEANELPELAVVKEDGTVSRFLDLYGRKPDATSEASAGDAGKAPRPEPVTLDLLQGAEFVPHGSQMLLTYPGTTRPMQTLDVLGKTRAMPIAIPGGYVLHDVLVSEARAVVVLRVKRLAAEKGGKDGAGESDDQERLFEFSSFNGALLREFALDNPSVSQVTCAAKSKLMAIFYDRVATVDGRAENSSGSDAPVAGSEGATQLVVSTVAR